MQTLNTRSSRSSRWYCWPHCQAYFEDSGWYTVDYSHAEHLAWGYHATCAFNGDCGQWPSNYLCTAAADGCSVGGLTQAYCNYETGLSIPFQYQYARTHRRHFADATAGGPNLLSDYCSYFQSYEGGQCTFTATGPPV